MKTLQKILATATLGLAMALPGCSSEDSIPKNQYTPGKNEMAVEVENVKPNKYEEMLFKADEITIYEKSFSWGKHYRIYVGDTEVASVKGKSWVGLAGDLFSLKTIDDKVIGSEKENVGFLQFKKAATLYDSNGTIDGYIGEENSLSDFFSGSHIFHIYNTEKSEIGKSKRGGLSNIGIYDSEGNLDYFADKKAFSWNDKYVFLVKDKSSNISLKQAILLVCIEDAIADAEEVKSSD